MHFSTFLSVLTLGLAHLTIAFPPLPHRAPLPATAIHALTYRPAKVLWHAWSSTTNITTLSTADADTFPAANVSACGAIAYDHTSPARTAVVRDDCYALAQQVQAAPGFWELYKWARYDNEDDSSSTRFVPLVSDGTCEFAVKRRDVPVGLNSSSSDVVM